MRYSALFAAICVFGFANSLFAQGFSLKSAELAISYGENSFSDKTFTIGPPQSSTPIKGTMKLDSGRIWEGRINFYNSSHIGAEVLYGYQYSGLTIAQTTGDKLSFSSPMQVHTITVNVLYYPFGSIESKTRPYVELGAGAVIYRPSAGGQTAAKDPLQGNFDTFFETSRPAASFDVGVKHILTKSLGVRADIGMTFSKVPTFGLPESSASSSAAVLPVGGLMNTVRGSAGIILYLGK
jgi:hypothetical protein